MSVKKTDNITPSLKQIASELKNLPKEAFKFWVDNTPIRTGNARRRTKLQNDVIHANYIYASRLDEGYSKQAPKGMSEPTTEFINRRVKSIMRK